MDELAVFPLPIGEVFSIVEGNERFREIFPIGVQSIVLMTDRRVICEQTNDSDIRDSMHQMTIRGAFESVLRIRLYRWTNGVFHLCIAYKSELVETRLLDNLFDEIMARVLSIALPGLRLEVSSPNGKNFCTFLVNIPYNRHSVLELTDLITVLMQQIDNGLTVNETTAFILNICTIEKTGLHFRNGIIFDCMPMTRTFRTWDKLMSIVGHYEIRIANSRLR